MNLFEVQARSDRSEVYSQRQWLIVADNLYEAMWLVPEERNGRSMRSRSDGPQRQVQGRVIGWMTGSTLSGRAGGSR